jgi:hypothetical protein
VTPSVSSEGATLENAANQGISARPAIGLHPGLHKVPETDPDGERIAALAAALLALSPDECHRLAVLLRQAMMAGQSEGKE